MRKLLSLTFLVLMIALMTIGTASAKKGKMNIKGEVEAVGDGSLTVKSNKGETYTITIPDGFELGAIQVGDSVLVKAIAGEGDTWLLETIKQVGPGSGDDDDDAVDDGDEGDDTDQEKTEGFKENSAFCAEGKQEKPHPLAPKIAERFGVSEEWVMDHFCEGYSIGAIMLAIKTSQLDGVTDSADQLLADRESGNGWGLIWKGLGLIGSEKEGKSPPGLLKRPAHAGPKNKD
jgi:hypothetical protein